MEEKFIKFYTLPNRTCSCRDESGFFTPIASRYKEFFNYLNEGINSADALNKMKIYRICCRIKFLSMPILPMIDRTSERYFDDTKKEIIIKGTDEILPKISPPEFPLLPIN